MEFFGKQIQMPGSVGGSASNGLPGVVPGNDHPLSSDVAAMLMTRGSNQKVIGEEDVKRASEILAKYKSGKANL